MWVIGVGEDAVTEISRDISFGNHVEMESCETFCW